MATNEELKEEVETANDKANALTDEKLTNVSGGLALDNVDEDDDGLEEALRRFKRETQRDNIIAEIRKREHYEKPSIRRKKKAEAARKRKY